MMAVDADNVERGAGLKEIERLMAAAAKFNASDLHLKPGQRPILRIHTQLQQLKGNELDSDKIKEIMYEIMNEKQIKQFEEDMSLDFAYSVKGIGRFRINIFHDRGQVSVAMRRVNSVIPTFEALHLPPQTKRIAEYEQGLVVVSGPTGSGKSTTLAAVLEYINCNQATRIITIEDPIEYLFVDKRSFISQREIGIDVPDWHSALKHMVREDPDVMLIGEMRDYISFDAALQAAETGHLVFTTVHASNAAQVISRLLDLFPTDRHHVARQNLAFNLRAVLCQRLLPSIKKDVRQVPAVEILFNNATCSKLILSQEDKRLVDLMRQSGPEGMQDFNQSLKNLTESGLVSKATALQYSPNPEQLKSMFMGIQLSDSQSLLG